MTSVILKVTILTTPLCGRTPDLLFTDSQPSDDTELDMPDIPVYAQRQVIITSDNAADIKGAVEESSMLHMRCYAHTINLSVQFTYCFVWTFFSLRYQPYQ